MAHEMEQWLGALGLERYLDTLVDNEIDLDTVPYVTDRDLADLGVALGARRRLMAAAAELRAADVADHHDVERRQLTLLFCDLVGSTELSQRLDPEDLREVMKSYQDAVVGAVTRFGGHVANYLGDGVLAYFGWPRAHEDQAAQAVRAGLAAVSSVANVALGDGRTLEGRVGIATGTVIVGDLVGERGRDVDAVIGETPNLAARLEGLAEPGHVVIESATLALLRRQFEVRDLGPQPLKGFVRPIPAHAVVRERSGESRFEQSRGASLTSLVGRDSERRLLLEKWELASAGRGQAVALAGEAGIGKSRLVRELRDVVAGDRSFGVRLQCSPLHTNTAYFPISQRLSRAAGIAAADDGRARLDKLARLLGADGSVGDHEVGLIAELLSIEAARPNLVESLTPLEIRRDASEILLGQVVSMARSGPVLLTVEDMQWADPSTEALIDDLIGQIDDVSVLLVMTRRPDDHRASRQSAATTIHVNRLGREQCREIVRHVSGSEPTDEMVDAIVARSDGNPLFVEELTRTLTKSDATTCDSGRSAVNEIPVSLEASLMARLDRLGPAKEVAQVASAVGREFDDELVAAVLGISDEALDAQLSTLVEFGVVEPQPDADERRHVFRHALLQEAAYASMLHSRQRDLHLRLADHIEQRRPGDPAEPEVLARHFELADRPEPAARYFALAGRQAAARYAIDEAISHFERALSLLPPGAGSTMSEFQIRIALGVVLTAARGYAATSVEQNYLRAQEIDGVAGSTAERFAVVRGLWNCYFDRGDLPRSLRLARDLVDLAEQGDDELFSSFASRALGSVELMRGEVARATRLLELGRQARSRSSGELDLHALGEDPGVICEMYLGWTKTAEGDIRDGLACSHAASEQARSGGQPIAVAFADTLRLVALVWTGYVEQARLLAGELEEFTRAHHLVFWAASARTYRGWTLPQPERGLEMMIAGFEAWKQTGARLHIPTFERVIMDGCLAVGDVVGARRAGGAAMQACDRFGENLHRADILRLLAACEVADGDALAAEALLREAIGVAAATGAGLFELRATDELARLLIAHGRVDAADRVLAAASAKVDADTDAPVVVRARQLLATIESA